MRPILSNNCFKCHGPAVQKSKLRLDERDPAIDRGAITPGKHAESELINRVLLPDSEDGRMPPVGVYERLTPDQVAKLKAGVLNTGSGDPFSRRPTRLTTYWDMGAGAAERSATAAEEEDWEGR